MLPSASGEPLGNNQNNCKCHFAETQEVASPSPESISGSPIHRELRAIGAAAITSFAPEPGEQCDFMWPGPDGVLHVVHMYCNGRGYGR